MSWESEEAHCTGKSKNMGFNMRNHAGFKIRILIRLVLVLVMIAMTTASLQSDYWMVGIWTGLLVLLLTAELLRYIHHGYSELEAMLTAIQNNDFSPNFSPYPRRKGVVNLGLNRIMDAFRSIRQEKETHLHYLETVISHVDQALLCFDGNRIIRLHNEALQKLFGRQKLTRLEDFQKIDAGIFSVITSRAPSETRMIRYHRGNAIIPLSVNASHFRIRGTAYTLIGFKDISLEIEENEVDSWQKLIRVLNHEIMNSAIPISTLTGVLNRMLIDDQGKETDLCMLGAGEESDLRKGLQTIEKRSRGLVTFTKSTRSLIHTGEPKFEKLDLHQLIDRVITLLKPDFEKGDIRVKWDVQPAGLTLLADQSMLEQMLINVLKNAREALENTLDGKIEITATREEDGKVLIRVMDNGCGIPRESLSQIFIPFYTTREKGSGIGLSLSRQIMRLHKGSISVESEVNHGTKFMLRF